MKLLVTRHGQTDWNVAKKVQGRTDIELNETGIQQAQIAREKLANEKIDLIITSPLKRAKKTAEIIAEGRNIPLFIDDAIAERCFGELEGKTRKDFDFDEVWDYKLNKHYKGAETVRDFQAKIQSFLTKIQKEYPSQTVLLVSHGGAVATIRKLLEGITEGIDNCEIKEFEL